MRHSLVVRACLALMFALPLGAQGAPGASTTIFVVRHAEKMAEPAGDPPLTAAGTARAEALAELLKDAGIRAVIATQFIRTRSTGEPTAKKLGLVVEPMDARAPTHMRMVADSVLAKHRGQTVLVVGHSNTVPGIIAAFGAPQPAAICDGEYDNLFVVTVPATGPASVVRLRYGAPSPACAP
jgi:broad specificity phosphatase PhoE